MANLKTLFYILSLRRLAHQKQILQQLQYFIRHHKISKKGQSYQRLQFQLSQITESHIIGALLDSGAD